MAQSRMKMRKDERFQIRPTRQSHHRLIGLRRSAVHLSRNQALLLFQFSDQQVENGRMNWSIKFKSSDKAVNPAD